MTTHPTVEGTDANFEEEVLRSPVPVLVDFWAQWCPPCRSLSPVVDEIAAETAGAAKVVKVNVEENPGLIRRYRVQSVPLVLFFKDGEVCDRARTYGQRRAAQQARSLALSADPAALSAGEAFTRTVAGGVPPARRQQSGPVLRANALPSVPGTCKFLASC